MDFTTKPLIFNPDGDDTIGARSLLGGHITNILNLNNVKYPWATEFYREMTGNFWLPEKHDLTPDKLRFPDLPPDDKEATEETIGFLQFLDSMQVVNLPNIFSWITSSEVSSLGAIQTFQEVIHAQTYTYILEGVLEPNRKQQVYYRWRDNAGLLNRNKMIANIYQDFSDKPNLYNFYRSLIANLVLEGIYFYNGFTYFYNLEYRNLLGGVAGLIRLINVDEEVHTRLFAAIIKTIHQEIKFDFDYKSLALEMIDDAVKNEIIFADATYSNKIVGMTKTTTKAYTESLGDKVCTLLGFESLYNAKNPYDYLSSKFGENQSGQRGNFFETNVGEYSMASALKGWDNI